MTSAGLQAITDAEHESNRTKDQFFPNPVYLTDGNGNLAVPGYQGESRVYYYEDGPTGIRVVNSAPLWADGSIPYAATIATSQPIEVSLGKPAHSDTVHVMTQTKRGIEATGGVSLKQQAQNQAQFPSEQSLQGFRVDVAPVSGLNEVYVNAGTYTIPSSGARASFPGALSSGIQAALTALAGSGDEQIAWITFDDASGAVHVETPVSASTPPGAIPEISDFTDSTIMAMTTTYKKLIPLYLWDGGSVAEAYIYRRLDSRLDWFPGVPSSSDTSAVHVNVANEISTLTVKSTPVSGDLLIIEDSAASGVKKKITVGSLPSGGGGTTIAARANTSAGQSIPGSYTSTVINYGTVDFDTGSNITTGSAWKFTASVAGVYRVSAAIAIVSTNTDVYLELWKNGSFYTTLCAFGMRIAGADIFLTGTTTVQLSIGDYIQVEADQEASGNPSLPLSTRDDFNYVDINLV